MHERSSMHLRPINIVKFEAIARGENAQFICIGPIVSFTVHSLIFNTRHTHRYRNARLSRRGNYVVDTVFSHTGLWLCICVNIEHKHKYQFLDTVVSVSN